MKIKKLKKDKIAWLRIIEAFLAILIIFAVIISIIASKENKSNLDKETYEKMEYVMDLIQKNETLRTEIIQNPIDSDNSDVEDEINKIIPGAWEFDTKICQLDLICTPDNVAPLIDKEIYYSEKIFTATSDLYMPRKLTLAVWMK
ncbi:hypothetical protein GOV12_01995 [Candidatus Pacearchaeota archaeon]|nr:hypothetical protein [Candidatus Pacearchaeota archaeon]